MSRKPESRGTCAYCGETITRRTVGKHLDACPPYQDSSGSCVGRGADLPLRHPCTDPAGGESGSHGGLCLANI